MIQTKQMLNTEVRPTLRLSEVEKLIKMHRIIVPPPTRPTLIKRCEEGALETVGGKATKFGWLVYEDSFWKWARELAGEQAETRP